MVDKTQLEGMVDGLNLVKEEFIKNKEELKISVRKDVVATELKDVLANSTDYDSLKTNIINYIDKLYKNIGG